MIIVLLGAPGVGKGTLAQKLVSDYDFAHLSTGDLLRAAVAAETPLGLEAKSYMDAGSLVPDELVIGLVTERLGDDETPEGVLLDGFPRNLDQARALDDALPELGLKIDSALLIEAPQEVIIDRLSNRRVCRTCGYTGTTKDLVCPRDGGEMYQRDDDKPATIQHRLDVYATETEPLLAYYAEQDLLTTVDGAQDESVVYAQVKERLGL